MKGILQRVKEVIAPSLFLTFTFFVFGPLQLYITNASELWFSLSDILWICVIAGVVCFLLFLGFGSLFPKNLRDFYIVLIFGIALALYIQGNFIPTDYGTLDGGSIDWGQYTGTAIWNTVLWVACIAFPFLLKKILKDKLVTIFSYVSWGIVAVQIITLVVLEFTIKPSAVATSLTYQGAFELSNNKNTVVFILDAFDSSDYKGFVESNPEYTHSIFQDFEYYPDTVGRATRTEFALPYILTGCDYEQGESYQEYIDRAFETTDLYDTLISLDYTVGLYTSNNFVSGNMKDQLVNMQEDSVAVGSYSKLAYYLYRFTACSYFPHILKEQVWMYSGDFNDAAEVGTGAGYTINDAVFYQNLKAEPMTVSEEGNAFRLYHLMGAHSPYTLDANSERVSSGTTQEEQLKGVINILETYFNEMKRLGIYDEANIIIMADHGTRNVEQNPLLLIKRGQETTAYTVNEIPVSYSNFYPTLMELVGGKADHGISIAQLQAEDNNERYFYAKVGSNNRLVLCEYLITGPAWDPDACTATGLEIPLYASDANESGEYALSTELFFDNRVTALPYLMEGFSGNEPTHTWSNEIRSKLKFVLEEGTKKDLLVEINLAALIQDRQRVSIYINDVFLNTYLVTDKELVFSIPNELIQDNSLEITILYFDTLRLADIQEDGDGRTLALAYYSMRISEIEEGEKIETSPVLELEKTTSIDFSENGNNENYLGNGWHGQEEERRWTSERAELTLIFDKGEYNNIAIDAVPYAHSGATEVLFNGQPLGSITDSGVTTFTIPQDSVLDSGIQTLTFVTENATSPKESGESEDDRILGVMVSKVELLNSAQGNG